MADLTHLTERVPHGHGNPAEAERRHEAAVSATRLELAARIVVDSLARGDEGAARRYLHGLQHDPGQPVDPWLLIEAVGSRALLAGAGGSRNG